MLTVVRPKPIAVWAVRAVPTNQVSASSDSRVEKTPESAMTAAPQIAQKIKREGRVGVERQR
jgi:hypothetical protein